MKKTEKDLKRTKSPKEEKVARVPKKEKHRPKRGRHYFQDDEE